MGHTPVSVWIPDRPASRRDVALIGSALFFVGLYLSSADQVAWPWVVVGFLVNAVLFGPVAKSPVGQRIGNWVGGFNPAGQKVVIALVILLTVAVTVTTVPETIGRGFTTGAFLFIALSLTANALSTDQAPE